MEVVSQDEFVEVYEHADPEKPSCIPRSFHPTALVLSCGCVVQMQTRAVIIPDAERRESVCDER